jgi:hypothetical protein
MVGRRTAIAAVVAVGVVFFGPPALAKSGTETITYVVSGGDLQRSFSIDANNLYIEVPGQAVHYASRVPALTGLRYHVQLYNGHSLFDEWTYVPAAGGALPLRPVNGYLHAEDGGAVRWLAFSPAFNFALSRAIKDGPARPYLTLAVVMGLLIVLAGAGISLAPPGALRRHRRGLARATAG